MGFLSQQLLLSRLKKFIKNLEKDKVKTSLRTGTVELQDVELDAVALCELISDAMPDLLPFGVEIVDAQVDTLQIVVPWTKLHSHAVEVHVGHVRMHCTWHLPGNIASAAFFSRMQLEVARRVGRKGATEKAPQKESIFDHILQVGALVTIASVEVCIARGEKPDALVLRMMELSLAPELRGTAKEVSNDTPSKPFASFRKTAKVTTTTPYRQARHFSRRQRVVSLWRRLKLKQLVMLLGDDRWSIFDLAVVEERTRPSDGRRTCPWNLIVAHWFRMECLEYRGSTAGLGRCIALLDEIADGEGLRHEAPRAVAEATRPLVSLDDFLDGEVDDEDVGYSTIGLGRPTLTHLIAVDGTNSDHLGTATATTSFLCAQQELEKEGVKWEDDAEEHSEDSKSGDENDTNSRSIMSKVSDIGTHVGKVCECAVDRVNLHMSSLTVILHDAHAHVQRARPLRDDEMEAYAVLFGKFANTAIPSQTGFVKSKSLSVRHASEQVLDVGEVVRRRCSTSCEVATFAGLLAQANDPRRSQKLLHKDPMPSWHSVRASSVPSSVRKNRRERTFTGNSANSADSGDGERGAGPGFEVKFESSAQGNQRAMPCIEVDACRVRAAISGCRELLRIWQEEVLVEREAYRDVRPKEEIQSDKRVPYHLVIRDLTVSEDSPDFQQNSPNRFPTVTEINHIDVRTLGPSPTRMQALPPKYKPRTSVLNPANLAEDPEQQLFWSRFHVLGNKWL